MSLPFLLSFPFCAPALSPTLALPFVPLSATPISPLAGSLKNHQEVDMNVVRICFLASYRDSQGQLRRLDPVLSEPVYDKSECWHPLGGAQANSE